MIFEQVALEPHPEGGPLSRKHQDDLEASDGMAETRGRVLEAIWHKLPTGQDAVSVFHP